FARLNWSLPSPLLLTLILTLPSDPSLTMYRSANFLISKNLNKAEKMPNFNQWRVAESDRSVEGPLLLYIRSKGYFFDRICQPAIRYCVLTKRGFLLIYTKSEKGFVVDIRSAFEVKSISDRINVQKREIRRCRIKIRYTFGTINIILAAGKIELWRDLLLDAAGPAKIVAEPNYFALPPVRSDLPHTPPRASSMYGPMESAEVSPSLVALKSFSNSSDEQVSKKDNWARVKTPLESDISVATAVDLSTCDDEYQYLSSSRLPTVDEEFSIAETSTSGLFNHNSIRESDIPVGWLRRQLENKIIAAEKRKSVYVAPPVIPAVKSTSTPSILSEKTIKASKKVKFSEKSPVKATARSVPSDSCDNSYDTFQFWRSSIFESDV
ncbi:hypothetical protein PFISCL1PPCAC_24913, partial [Pristionchus fissidentatus]